MLHPFVGHRQLISHQFFTLVNRKTCSEFWSVQINSTTFKMLVKKLQRKSCPITVIVLIDLRGVFLFLLGKKWGIYQRFFTALLDQTRREYQLKCQTWTDRMINSLFTCSQMIWYIASQIAMSDSAKAISHLSRGKEMMLIALSGSM